MIIRKAVISDAPAIARIHVDTWKSTYTGLISKDFLQKLSYKNKENQWNDRLKNPKEKHFVYVAEDEYKEVIGFAMGGLEQFEPESQSSKTSNYKGKLMAIYILKDHQRKGIGTQLVRKIVEYLLKFNITSMLVWVLKDNPYCEFYKKLEGRFIDKKLTEIDGIKYIELAFGWDNIRKIINNY